MSCTGGRSNRKRIYKQTGLPDNNVEVKDFQYDEFKDTCVHLYKSIQELTQNHLKRCKPAANSNRPINLQEVREFAKKTIHYQFHTFNNELGIEFGEIKKLKKEIDALKEEQHNEIESLNRSHKIEINDMGKKHYNEMNGYKHQINEREKYIKELEQHSKKEKDLLRQSQEEIDKIQQEHDNEIKKYQELLQQQNESQTQVVSLQSELERIKEQNDKLQQTLHDERKDRERLQQENQQSQRLQDENQQSYQRLQHENQQIRELAHNLNLQLQEYNAEIHRLNGNIQQLQRQLSEEREKKESEKKQKDEALTRLSAIAGDRLRSNNPGITDLSDPNRPMKIAEKFAELYDNDWTDAMETLENHGLEEKECIGILLHFLTDAYEECGKRVKELDSFLQQAVLMSAPDGQADQSGDSGQELPAEITKPIKDLRRKLTDNNIEVLQKILPQHLKEKRNLTEDQIKDCEDFIKDCIKYAWMMQIQDPPVYIEWDFPEETKIDTNILRSYTKAGEKVDYIVWPVLYLHKNGPVLNKGVVQPISTKKQ